MTSKPDRACVLYGSDIEPKEKAALKSMESAIISTLIKHSFIPRPMWTISTNPGPRTLQLYAFADMEPRVLAEVRVDKIDTHSEEDLITLITENIKTE